MTTLNFSKTFHPNWNDPYFGELFDVGIYVVSDGPYQKGYFLVSGEGSYFVLNDLCYYTERFKKNPFGDTYAIKRFDTEEQVGTYRNYGFYNGAYSYGSVIIAGEEFISSRGVPDTRFSLFRKSTWGHYKLLVLRKSDSIAYQFQAEQTGRFGRNLTEFKLEGTVQLGSANLLVLLSGFYFIERMLSIDDISA
ncbi:MAG: hypothetical protein ACO1NW_17245 [Chitinophagaceae bacterium]